VQTTKEKQFNEELKEQWKNMWRSRLDDKVRAEGIADKDYCLLFVERGTVIMATRKFKALDLYEIMQQHRLANLEVIVSPNPSVGGWGKFIRSVLSSPSSSRRRRHMPPVVEKRRGQQLRKGGRGWLHAKR